MPIDHFLVQNSYSLPLIADFLSLNDFTLFSRQNHSLHDGNPRFPLQIRLSGEKILQYRYFLSRKQFLSWRWRILQSFSSILSLSWGNSSSSSSSSQVSQELLYFLGNYRKIYRISPIELIKIAPFLLETEYPRLSPWEIQSLIEYNGYYIYFLRNSPWRFSLPLVKTALKENGNLLSFLPESIQNDEEIYTLAWENGLSEEYFPIGLYHQKRLIYQSIERNLIEQGEWNEQIPEEFLFDPAFLLLVLEKGFLIRKSYFPPYYPSYSSSPLSQSIIDHGLSLGILKYHEFPETLRMNDSIALLSIKTNPISLSTMPGHYRNSYSLLKESFHRNGLSIKYIGKSYRNHYLLNQIAIQQNSMAFLYIGKPYQSDPSFIIPCLRDYGRILEFIPTPMKDQEEIVIEAIKQNGLAIQFASERIRSIHSFGLLALKCPGSSGALEFLSDSLKNSKEIVFTAINREIHGQQVGNAFSHAGPDCKRDISLVRYALEGNPRVYEEIPQEIQENVEIALLALKLSRNPGNFLQNAPESIRDNEIIVQQCIESCGLSLSYASKRLRSMISMILLAIEENPSVYCLLPSKYQNHPEIEQLYHMKILWGNNSSSSSSSSLSPPSWNELKQQMIHQGFYPQDYQKSLEYIEKQRILYFPHYFLQATASSPDSIVLLLQDEEFMKSFLSQHGHYLEKCPSLWENQEILFLSSFTGGFFYGNLQWKSEKSFLKSFLSYPKKIIDSSYKSSIFQWIFEKYPKDPEIFQWIWSSEDHWKEIFINSNAHYWQKQIEIFSQAIRRDRSLLSIGFPYRLEREKAVLEAFLSPEESISSAYRRFSEKEGFKEIENFLLDCSWCPLGIEDLFPGKSSEDRPEED